MQKKMMRERNEFKKNKIEEKEIKKKMMIEK